MVACEYAVIKWVNCVASDADFQVAGEDLMQHVQRLSTRIQTQEAEKVRQLLLSPTWFRGGRTVLHPY